MLDKLYSPQVLRELIRHDPETGELFWKTRSAEHFDPSSKLNICRSWNARYAGKRALNNPSTGYLSGEIFSKRFLAHRVIWALHYGEWPENIDHINGNTMDNRIANLRSVTHSENMRNCKCRKDNAFPTGVHPFRKKWKATITHNRKQIHLGVFDSLADALWARKAAEIKYGFHANHGRNA